MFNVGDTIYFKRDGGAYKVVEYFEDHTVTLSCLKTGRSCFTECLDLIEDYETVQDRRKRIIKGILEE